MKKILVSDYDGTFYINDEEIKKNIEKVEEFRKDGNKFIIATGRSYFDFNKKKELYNIKYDYLIIDHGATILDNKENIINSYLINKNIKEQLIKELNLKNHSAMFSCSILEGRVDINQKNITKINVRYETLERATKINNYINETYKDEIISYLIPSGNEIEIISSKTNKAKAIEEIAKIENIEKINIFTIGDSYNDIEMIQGFNGYCIKNSIDEVKKVSMKEYKSVSELIDNI